MEPLCAKAARIVKHGVDDPIDASDGPDDRDRELASSGEIPIDRGQIGHAGAKLVGDTPKVRKCHDLPRRGGG